MQVPGPLVAEHHLETAVMARKQWTSFYPTAGVCLLLFIFVNITVWWLAPSFAGSKLSRNLPPELQSPEAVTLMASSPEPDPRDLNCTFHNFSCLEVYHCGYDDKTVISIYIYPIQQYYDETGSDMTPPMSTEFEEMLRVIAQSPYYTRDPETACFFIPSIDLLNQNWVKSSHQISQILASLKW